MDAIQTDLYQGERIRLVMEEPEVMAKLSSKWSTNSEYIRSLDSAPEALFSFTKIKEWIEKDLEKADLPWYLFHVKPVDADCVIGFVSLWDVQWNHGEAFVAIGFGEREDWNKGYGSETMNLALRYAFQELNLNRVSLYVYEHNPRAIRSYEKIGFQHEGRLREAIRREGQRWDVLIMGILHSEWETRQDPAAPAANP